MGKLIIAIEIPEYKGTEDYVIVAVWGKGVLKDIKQTQMKEIKVGEIVSFDNSYLTSDREDDSFIEAEFRAWEPDEKTTKQIDFEEEKPENESPK